MAKYEIIIILTVLTPKGRTNIIIMKWDGRRKSPNLICFIDPAFRAQCTFICIFRQPNTLHIR